MNAVPFVYFSNRVEILYEHLREILFDPSRSSVFTRRLIIVPSPAMKSWLMLRMAQDPDLGIATGLRIAYLNESLEIINSELGATPTYKTIPNALELSFAIENAIKHKKEPEWSQVSNYISSGSPLKNGTRCASFSDQLAQLFVRYGNYGGNALEEWNGAQQSRQWQVQLWKDLHTKYPQWSYPYQKLTDFTFVTDPGDYQVHLFAMSFVSRLHYNFFNALAQKIPVLMWIMSPCQAFWSDLCSDKEKQKLRTYWQKKNVSEKQLQDLELYLRDRNPLLANFGKLGKEMALQIEESNAIVDSLFELPETILKHPEYADLHYDEILLHPSDHPLTLLEAVQSDLALLRTPHKEKIALEFNDNSIQVHCSSSKLREIQVLHDNLLALINKDKIAPSQIIVMAPDIIDYEPYIRAVFGAEDSKLDWQMMDLPMQSQNSLAQVFLQLLNLPVSRWEASALYAIFQQPAFHQRHGLKKEDVETLKEWIRKFGICWGQDSEHRQSILARDYGIEQCVETSEGTWESGWRQSLQTLAIEDPEGKSIDYARSELLGKCIALCRSLRTDLRKFEGEQMLNLDEWADVLHDFIEKYLSSKDDPESFEALMQLVRKFKDAARCLKTEKYPFISIRLRVLKAMEGKDFSYRESHLQAVRFCSMLPMRAVPAQVVVLLGLHEGAYPRKDLPFSLNLLTGNTKADYCPTNTDYDRYLFLEALLSARKYFLLSFCDYAPSDPKPLPPAIIVSELLTYLDNTYLLGSAKPSTTLFKRHPFHPFDSVYFIKGSGFTSFSQKAYKQALSYYKIPKEQPHCVIEHFPAHTPVALEESKIIDLAELSKILSNPLKHYVNKGLGLYVDKKSYRELTDDESFEMKSWDFDEIVKQSLKIPLSDVIANADQKGVLPAYPFKQTAYLNIRNAIDELKENIPEDVFSIEFNMQCKQKARLDNGDWILPPMKIILSDHSIMHIVGKIPYISSKGIVYNGSKRDFPGYVRFYPNYLAYAAAGFGTLANFPDLSKQKKALDIDPEEQLRLVIEYALACRSQASPLIKSWARPILQGKTEVLAKAMADSLGNNFSYGDEYVKWAYSSNRFPDPAAIIETWQPQATRMFGAIEKTWCGK